MEKKNEVDLDLASTIIAAAVLATTTVALENKYLTEEQADKLSEDPNLNKKILFYIKTLLDMDGFDMQLTPEFYKDFEMPENTEVTELKKD